VPQNPNFLWGFGDPTNFMRSRRAGTAHAVLGGAAYRKFGSFAFLAKVGYATFEDPTLRKKARRVGHPEFCCSAQDFHGGPVSRPRGPAKPAEDCKESRMGFIGSTKLHRKSGVWDTHGP
jgi:hypothetical protein